MNMKFKFFIVTGLVCGVSSSIAQATTLKEWKEQCITPYFENYGYDNHTSVVGFLNMVKCTKKAINPEQSEDTDLQVAFKKCTNMESSVAKCQFTGDWNDYMGIYAVYMCMYKVF